jgi:hypothetical protein
MGGSAVLWQGGLHTGWLDASGILTRSRPAYTGLVGRVLPAKARDCMGGAEQADRLVKTFRVPGYDTEGGDWWAQRPPGQHVMVKASCRG